jgi:hypothetical protein
MVGLLVLIFLVGYVAFWFYLIRRARNRLEKVAAISIALLIPFWDLPIGYGNYRMHCERDGGLHVFEKFAPSDSIFIDGLGCAPQQLAKAGFRLIECQADSRSKVIAFTATKKGIETSENLGTSSKYKLSSISNQPAGWNVMRSDVVLARIGDNKILAKHSEFQWRGLWWQIELAPLAGAGPQCHTRGDQTLWRLALKGTQ